MGSTYIDNYEKNLVENAVKSVAENTKEKIALKMKADGVSSELIFKYCGIWL